MSEWQTLDQCFTEAGGKFPFKVVNKNNHRRTHLFIGKHQIDSSDIWVEYDSKLSDDEKYQRWSTVPNADVWKLHRPDEEAKKWWVDDSYSHQVCWATEKQMDKHWVDFQKKFKEIPDPRENK